MVSNNVVVLIVSVIIVVITFAFFGYPIMMMIHKSATEINIKAFFNLHNAITDANRHGIGMTQKNLYLQNGYFIVVFNHNEVLEKLVRQGGYTELFHDVSSGSTTSRRVVGVVNTNHISGSDQLSVCEVGKNCICLLNLDYTNYDRISTRKYNMVLFPNTHVYQVNPMDLKTTFFRNGRFTSLSKNAEGSGSGSSSWDHLNVFLQYSTQPPENPLFPLSSSYPDFTKVYTDFSTYSFFNYFIRGIADSFFKLKFVKCTSMRDLCTCDVCSLYTTQASCLQLNYDGAGLYGGGNFGCNWSVKCDENDENCISKCYNEEGYANATKDCSIWYTSEGGTQYQFSSILEASKFEFIVFNKDGCAVNLVDLQKKPIVLDVLEDVLTGNDFPKAYGQNLFRICNNVKDDPDYKEECLKDKRNDKLGRCSFCFGVDCAEEKVCPLTS